MSKHIFILKKKKKCVCNSPSGLPCLHGCCWDCLTHTSLWKRRSLWIRETVSSPSNILMKKHSVTSADDSQINRLSSTIYNETFLAKIGVLF